MNAPNRHSPRAWTMICMMSQTRQKMANFRHHAERVELGSKFPMARLSPTAVLELDAAKECLALADAALAKKATPEAQTARDQAASALAAAQQVVDAGGGRNYEYESAVDYSRRLRGLGPTL